MANPEQGPKGETGETGAKGATGPRGLTGPRGPRSWERLNQFRSSRIGVGIFYGYLAAIIVVSFIVARSIIDLHDVANQNHRVLCNEKHALERGLKGANEYLRQHPHGTESFSRGLIVSVIVQDRLQLAAFKDVTCEP